MDAFELAPLIARHQRSGQRYFEFLRAPSLSLGLYALPVGGMDEQRPHTEDEVYFVVSGRSSVQVAAEEREVEPGSIIYVGAGVEHRFHSIAEDLTLLVFFAPAEDSTSA